MIAARQQADAVRLHKWLLVAPFGEITALVSFEVPSRRYARYPEQAIRAAMATVAVRTEVPAAEKLTLLPFKLSDLAGLRLVRVVPGVALQLTDGPQDALEAYEQPHLVISAAPGGPQQARDRDQFARLALAGLPPLKEVRVVSSESMRIGGQPGHEIRAEGKAPQTDADIEIVQWLRFGTGAYLRILGIAPKEWTDTSCASAPCATAWSRAEAVHCASMVIRQRSPGASAGANQPRRQPAVRLIRPVRVSVPSMAIGFPNRNASLHRSASSLPM